MSEPVESDTSALERAPAGDGAGEIEPLDALPVLAPQAGTLRSIPFAGALADELRSPGVMIGAAQAAVVAAGGFVAGAAVVGLAHRRQRARALGSGRRAGRELARSSRRASGGELLQIVGSRSLLVDVHLLGGHGRDG
ncbi:MAG: hypothetical protein QOI03_1373 [Solirubrobacteraceae bacterium]|jgi:hypothetical protein|nr:hypothetical protein [Solirubrobacteraceae bacterium]